MKLNTLFIALSLSSLAPACVKSKFKEAIPIGTNQPEGVAKVWDLSCEQTPDLTLEVSPKPGAALQIPSKAPVTSAIRGRFCATGSDNLTVLFIIDFSGSMGPNMPDFNTAKFQPTSGNDPRTSVDGAKTCGRLQAVEAILSKFNPADKVKFGTVAFAGDIVESHTSAPMDGQSFRASRLDPASKLDNFCSYIAPNDTFKYEEMAVPNAAVSGATNYAAAFNRAASFLRNSAGRKLVFFITDGRPTEGGLDPLASGQAAAAQLKSIENLYLNAFFLQNRQAGLQEDKQGFDNLVQTIGNAEHVVRVDSAAQLAVEVGKEPSISFDPAQIKASLLVGSQQSPANLKIVRFAPDPANARAWVFETEPFTLTAPAAEPQTHLVKINATAKDGTAHSSTVTLIYQPSVREDRRPGSP